MSYYCHGINFYLHFRFLVVSLGMKGFIRITSKECEKLAGDFTKGLTPVYVYVDFTINISSIIYFTNNEIVTDKNTFRPELSVYEIESLIKQSQNEN